ncbi:hypothetical protein IQ266_13215 [filamentous cyanobacterium LEGE 11480]|uniref:Uncharacterized protein n=1 Tax=Romeriopsis navalis LEGE 11480 TaxID=2777977 RepID=A0A928Z2S4_9CYAN|nr:hypothetical protein [Romeriopsis navalis]MBE9030691.1 hypothetical protein [Romeriopsis navalis LEGE 11480]
MKPMIWHPEANDQQVRAYFNEVNHAPYQTIVAVGVVGFCLFTLMVLLASF